MNLHPRPGKIMYEDILSTRADGDDSRIADAMAQHGAEHSVVNSGKGPA